MAPLGWTWLAIGGLLLVAWEQAASEMTGTSRDAEARRSRADILCSKELDGGRHGRWATSETIKP